MKMPVVSCMQLKFTHITMSPQLIAYSLATFHILNAINCFTEQMQNVTVPAYITNNSNLGYW